MADNTTVETVIFEVDVSSYQNKLVGLTQNIDALKTQQKALREETEKGGKGYLKAAEELEKVNAELKVSQDEYRNTQRTLVGFIGAHKNQVDTTNFANNSIKANRELLKQLQSQYINTKNPTQEFTKTILTLTNELKKQESAIGDTRRNVGNYAEGFKEAAKDLNLFGVNLGGVGAGLRASRDGFVAAGGGVKGFSAALATTGLPLIIMAVSQLTKVFEAFKPVADAVETVVTAIGAGFKALIDGGSIAEAGKQAAAYLETLRDLEDTENGVRIAQEKRNNEVRFLITSSKDLGKSIKERNELLAEAEKLQKKNFEEDLKRNEIRKKGLSDLLKNQTGLTQNQLDILAKATDATDKYFLQYKAQAESRTSFDEEKLKDYQNVLLEEEKLRGNNVIELEKIINAGNKLIEKQQAAEEKARAAKEAADAKAKAAKAKYDQDIERLTDEFLLSEREKLNKSFEDKKDLIKGQSDNEQILRLTIADEQAKALAQFDKDIEDKKKADQKAKDDKAFNDAVAYNQRQLELDLNFVDLSTDTVEQKEQRKREIQLAALEKQLQLTKDFLGADGIITKEELQGITAIEQAIAKLRQVTTTPAETTLGDAIGVSKEQVNEIQQGLQTASQAVKGITDVINSSYQVRLNDIENVKNAEIDAIEQSGASQEDKAEKIQQAERKAAIETYEIQKKQFEVNKAIAIVQTIINTAQAVIAQFANPTPFAGAVLAALAAATGAAQLAVIASQPAPSPPKFAEGGEVFDIGGKPHSQGGTKYRGEDGNVIEVERGEKMFVMKATAAKQIHKLSQFNQMFGGRSWNGAPINYAAQGGVVSDGGFSTSMVTEQIKSDIQTKNAIREAFINAPQPVVSVREITNVTKAVNKSVAVSEL